MWPNVTTVAITFESANRCAHGSNRRASAVVAVAAEVPENHATCCTTSSPSRSRRSCPSTMSAMVRCSRRLLKSVSASFESFTPAYVKPASAASIVIA